MTVQDVAGGNAPKKDWKAQMLAKKKAINEDAPAPQASVELKEGELTDQDGRTQTEVHEEMAKPVKEKKVKEPKAPKAPKEKKDKAPETVKNGWKYSLVSRVRNAFSNDKRSEIEAGSASEDWVNGKGQTLAVVPAPWIKIAEENGITAEVCASIRTSHVKAKLKEKGVDLGKKAKGEKAPKEDDPDSAEGHDNADPDTQE